jgi:hypothetical protein
LFFVSIVPVVPVVSVVSIVSIVPVVSDDLRLFQFCYLIISFFAISFLPAPVR